MKAVIQRVAYADLYVLSAQDIERNASLEKPRRDLQLREAYSSIDYGMLALIAIEKGDDENIAERMLLDLLGYRIFTDSEGRMNLSLRNIKGQLMLVSQFTLAAETKKGLRPGFSEAEEPVKARKLFNYMFKLAELKHKEENCPYKLAGGKFGSMMRISLLNDGPVTFILQR